MLIPYLNEIEKIARNGDGTEGTFYGALKNLLYNFGKSTNRKDILLTVLPKKTEADNPDFRIAYGKTKIVGYIEAKLLETNPIRRYSTTFPNFIEFRLYKCGTRVDKVTISTLNMDHRHGAIPVKIERDFETLMEKFLSFSKPTITTTDRLADELAKGTAFLRDQVLA